MVNQFKVFFGNCIMGRSMAYATLRYQETGGQEVIHFFHHLIPLISLRTQHPTPYFFTRSVREKIKFFFSFHYAFDWYTKRLFLRAKLVTKYIFLLKSSITLGLNTYQPRIQDSSVGNSLTSMTMLLTALIFYFYAG